MRVKCRGYTGTLLRLESEETTVHDVLGDVVHHLNWYDVEIRLDTGEKVSIDGVSSTEIEVVP